MLSDRTRPYCETAVTALKQMLEEDRRSHADLARAIRCVITVRNRLIEDRRSGLDVDHELNQVNSLLSLGHGAEFPLVGFHRDRIEKVCRGIGNLLSG